MRFHLNNKLIKIDNVLQDDTIRDVALKMTNGAGGVYLYAKQSYVGTVVTVWEKYERPLTAVEMFSELRNVGITTNIQQTKFDFEDLSDVYPYKTPWQYIPLGQTFARGVRVKPPKEEYTVAEYEGVRSFSMLPEKRLFHYENLTDIYAVHVAHKELTAIYRLHNAGVVADDKFLARVPAQMMVWSFSPSVCFVPQGTPSVDLFSLFRHVSAHPEIPNITYKDVTRTLDPDSGRTIFNRDAKGLTFHFKNKKSKVTFYSSGIVRLEHVEVGFANPVIHYVHRVLRFGTGFESDYKILGRRIDESPSFDASVFPLCKEDSEKLVSLESDWTGDRPTHVSGPWSKVFDSKLRYVRCTPPAQVEFEDGKVRLMDVDPRCMNFATTTVELFLSSTHDMKVDFSMIEAASEVAKEPTHMTLLKRFGYIFKERFLNGVIAEDTDGLEGFLPIVSEDEAGVVHAFLQRWVPSKSYECLKAFLCKVGMQVSEFTPDYKIVHSKGCTTGILLRNGAYVECVESRSKDGMPSKTYHEMLFPQTPRLYGMYRELVKSLRPVEDWMPLVSSALVLDKTSKMTDAGFCLSKEDAETFASKLRDEIARFHRVRSYIFSKSQLVKGVECDLAEGEIIC